MIGKESKHSGYVSLNRVIEILDERKKEKELTYEQQIAYEHATKFAPTTGAEQKVRKGLEGLGVLGESTIVAIVTAMPMNEMLLKRILAGENKAFTEEEVKSILSITNPK